MLKPEPQRLVEIQFANCWIVGLVYHWQDGDMIVVGGFSYGIAEAEFRVNLRHILWWRYITPEEMTEIRSYYPSPNAKVKDKRDGGE